MIAYRKQRREVRTSEVLRQLESATGLERQMLFGELEAGVADALCPDRDEELPVLSALRHGEWRGLGLPEKIEISVPEGFAYYALDPEMYRIAARRFVAEMHPSRVAVIGIRSIGTTLSTVVERELQRLGVSTRSWTVRPTGHPWDRQLATSEELEQEFREWDGWFAIVDEGPGLSGSSFCAVASFLANERIVLFPSWSPDGSRFVCEAAREMWSRYPKYCAAFEELERFPEGTDYSGGAWREALGIRAAVQPQHERRKYLVGDRLYKFAGFGRYGRAALERARALEGWVAEPLSLEHGFLASRWLTALPARANTHLVDFAARYIAAVRRRFATGAMADPAPLIEAIRENCGLEWSEPVPEAEAVVLDNRMLPHEWLETAQGYRKADALDHGDDHFLPGPHDPAWDLAGFSVEFGLDHGGEEYLLERYGRESGDRSAGARLPFYRAAYLAFRLGYCELAIQALGDSEDGRGFAGERSRYVTLLRQQRWMRQTSLLSA